MIDLTGHRFPWYLFAFVILNNFTLLFCGTWTRCFRFVNYKNNQRKHKHDSNRTEKLHPHGCISAVYISFVPHVIQNFTVIQQLHINHQLLSQFYWEEQKLNFYDNKNIIYILSRKQDKLIFLINTRFSNFLCSEICKINIFPCTMIIF